MIFILTSSVANEGESVHGVSMRGAQIRAARELLGLSQEELAVSAKVSRPTVRDIERETGDPRRSSMLAVETYLRSRGIRFVDELGLIGAPPG